MLYRRLLHRLIFTAILAVITTGCGNTDTDSRLTQVGLLASVSPTEALDSLSAIEYGSLSEANRHLYDLLWIKASDKAYVVHTSDSLILDVIGYYSSHRKTGLYPEALYYGGRVYSDLGDYPTALQYFHRALDALPPDGETDLDFKANVLSQTGRLLIEIRMYSQALPYLEETIELDKQLSDTFALAYDNMLLCDTYLKTKDFDKATSHMREAVRYASCISSADSASVAIYEADILYRKGEIDSALNAIRGLPELCTDISRNRSLASAISIYYAAGIMDTAYMYARQLAGSDNYNNRKIGYHYLLDPDVRQSLPSDSIISLVGEYVSVIERNMDNNEVESALIQNSYYNYAGQVRDKERAVAQKKRLGAALILTAILALALGVIVLYTGIRRTRRRHSLEAEQGNIVDSDTGLEISSYGEGLDWNNPLDIDNIKKSLLDHASDHASDHVSGNKKYTVPAQIGESEIYSKINVIVNSGKAIATEELWYEAETVVEQVYPGFRCKMRILTDYSLSEASMRMAILTKFGYSTKDMAMLLNITKGGVTARRGHLSSQIFGVRIPSSKLNYIIRQL